MVVIKGFGLKIVVTSIKLTSLTVYSLEVCSMTLEGLMKRNRPATGRR